MLLFLIMDWPRYARALDLHLAGRTLQQIGDELGVTRQRARQMVMIAKRRLAYRVFYDVPKHHWTWDKHNERWTQKR